MRLLDMKGRTVYLFILIALIQTLYPITQNASTAVLIGYQTLYFLLVVVGILIVRHSPFNFWLLVVLGIMWMVGGIAFAFNPTDPYATIAAYATIALYQAVVVQVLMRYIFATERVTIDVIYAACAVYMLLGAIFVGVFGTIEQLTLLQTGQHAFIDAASSGPIQWQQLIYYSYVTLTSLGYGDVLPITWWARSFATLEAVLGMLYLTVIVARLVGLYAQQEQAS